MVEHGVVGGRVPVLQARGGHARQVAHAAVVGPVTVRHGTNWLWNGWIHGVESGVER